MFDFGTFSQIIADQAMRRVDDLVLDECEVVGLVGDVAGCEQPRAEPVRAARLESVPVEGGEVARDQVAGHEIVEAAAGLGLVVHMLPSSPMTALLDHAWGHA